VDTESGPDYTRHFRRGQSVAQRNDRDRSSASVFLLCGAGLLAQNLWTLISAPMGLYPNHVLAMRLKAPSVQQNAMASQAVFRNYLEQIAAIPEWIRLPR